MRAAGTSPSVGIDGYNLAMAQGTGIATYGFSLARTLASGGHPIEGLFGLHVGRDPDLRETLFFESFGREASARTLFGSRWQRRAWLAWATANPWLVRRAVPVPLTGKVDRIAFADQLPAFLRLSSVSGLFRLAQRHFNVTGRFLPVRMDAPPDVMHWTYPVPVRLIGAKNVYTIHDLVPLRLPYTTLGDKRVFRKIALECVRTADHVCTISEFCRSDIVDQLGADPGKVSNVYQTAFAPAAVLAEPVEQTRRTVQDTLGLEPDGYFLFFGTVEPKKNVGRLVEAFLRLGLDRPLVLVTSRTWLSEQETALLDHYDRQHDPRKGKRRLIVLPYLSRDLLARLIRVARGVLFPSISEGFGLPVLEAMQLGAPVLTSREGALAEVAGNAASLVPPYDVDAIAAGIRALDADDNLRASLAAAGLDRATAFSPERYLERLRVMYARAGAPLAGSTCGTAAM